MKKGLKLFSILAVAILMMSILAACGGGGSESASNGDSGNKKTKELKLGFNQPENHPQYKAMEEFSEKFYEETDGAYRIKIYPNELLGAQREVLELVQSGTVSMSITPGSLLENINKDFVVFNLPYVFDSVDHQQAVLNDPEVTGELFSSLEDQGLTVLGGFHGGVRNVYNSEKPVNTPEDLAGMKIRVMESDTNIQMMEYMGGVGTPMGQGEVYTAIQSGVIEGGENNELIYNNLKHVEIAPYYTYTQHLMVPDYLMINADVLKGMSEEHQKLLREGIVSAFDREFELFAEFVAEAKASAEEQGAKFNEVDIKVFQDAVAPLLEEKLENDFQKGLYEKVRELAQ
ncbi:TRAP transporter substrate-binding protein [Bacillus sp. REN16]|uniref:TRAP transporter substrate-binding protein n=1 Tax=Bacillus sp. REN16 TaxID=2887296 RepID=UPI001E56AA22|nr:TRAP transporter substrate-binding protein [Bacillus sp. REN16]MCC3356155.1 TRAP transporter substrate-binding protein [Bacillus sp. REN16]